MMANIDFLVGATFTPEAKRVFLQVGQNLHDHGVADHRWVKAFFNFGWFRLNGLPLLENGYLYAPWLLSGANTAAATQLSTTPSP